MFSSSIELASRFTRPIHTITRSYGANDVTPGSGTLFMVNEEGWALTCRHVVEVLLNAERINQHYRLFREELMQKWNEPGFDAHKKLMEQKYHLQPGSLTAMLNMFVNCVDRMDGFECRVHPVHDLALIRFNGFGKLYCDQFPVFPADDNLLKPGMFLCRLGFPFPEFSNYRFNPQSDQIEWTQQGQQQSPMFPIEGMITRFLSDANGLYGIEMSTPGLRGQSGGPLFDENGVVMGMQYATKHLHLGFDIENKEISVNGRTKMVNDYSFIHLGQCIHFAVIKAFMNENGVRYRENVIS